MAMRLDDLPWINVADTVQVYRGAKAAFIDTDDMHLCVYESPEGLYTIQRNDEHSGHFVWHSVTREQAQTILEKHCTK